VVDAPCLACSGPVKAHLEDEQLNRVQVNYDALYWDAVCVSPLVFWSDEFQTDLKRSLNVISVTANSIVPVVKSRL